MPLSILRDTVETEVKSLGEGTNEMWPPRLCVMAAISEPVCHGSRTRAYPWVRTSVEPVQVWEHERACTEASGTWVLSPRGLATPLLWRDSPGLEGLHCSLWDMSQLFQATRDHLLKRPWWFEKVNVLPKEETPYG